MKCNYCNEEKEVHLFYYDFFKTSYEEDKWGYLCDDCRKVFLKNCSCSYVSNNRDSLTLMQKKIEKNIKESKQNEFLSIEELKKYDIANQPDFNKTYKNINEIAFIILKKNNIPKEKMQEYKNYLKTEFLAFLQEQKNTSNVPLMYRINILLNVKLRELVRNDNMMSEQHLDYEKIQEYLTRSNLSFENSLVENTNNEEENHINSLMKSFVPSTESLYIEKENKLEELKNLNNAILQLEDFEREFIFLRFGFLSNPLSLSEMQKDYYDGFSLHELGVIEQLLLDQIKEHMTKPIIKKHTF